MNFGLTWYVLGLVCAHATAEKWRWPQAEARRIDDKLRFIDNEGDEHRREKNIQSDEAPFKEPTDTDGFYNRPPGAGRYPVKSEAYRQDGVYPVRSMYRDDGYNSDGTLDSLEYCKCVSTPECTPRPNSEMACGPGKFLCCYKRHNRQNVGHADIFNEVDDERPYLLPAQENIGGPFSSHLNSDPIHLPKQSVLVGPQGPTGNIGPPKSPVLVGPEGPTGIVGPTQKPILVGPDGPTGIIGPQGQKQVLVGPEGPTGIVGPQKKPVLVGPNGPTGVIGPANQENYENYDDRDVGPSGSAQRGVLVGPGGPTGVIGPYGRRPVLTGPGGPTGIIGPGRQRYFGGYNGYGRQRNPGLLVGPGGPTGIIGPGRGLLVGPGGPTGQIGPRGYNYFG